MVQVNLAFDQVIQMLSQLGDHGCAEVGEPDPEILAYMSELPVDIDCETLQ